MKKTECIQLVDRIATKTTQMDMTWEWPCGVAYYGLAKIYKITKKKDLLDFLKNRIDELIELGLESWTVNRCAMGHAVLTLYEETQEERYLEIIDQMLSYLSNEALRFGDGTLQHTVSKNNDFPEQCWADTLFMAAYFMLRAGVSLGRSKIVEDALNQYVDHIDYLQDDETGLWYHGYTHVEKHHLSGFYWGRANAWAAYTMSQVVKTLPEAYLYPQYMEIDGSLNELLSSIKFLQTEEGLWRTILDDSKSYEELSASSGIAAAMAANRNPLYQKYVEKSLAGIAKNISSDGKVLNVSGGTAVMREREDYRNITKKWIQGWGQGLALALFGEMLLQEDVYLETEDV